ncbi:MAG: molybdenum cofactor biosynthesis protein, partial [Deltaproteobacteria bacterium]|nr:molybdenum cofactor biosynthesis protein [Deltaproteobacteria bacterium]
MTANSFTIGVLTLSDKGARGEREDLSGLLLQEMVQDLGRVCEYQIIAD